MRSAWVLASLTLAAMPALAQLPESFNAVSGKQAIDAARASGKPVFLYFMQPNCGYCVKTEKLLDESPHKAEIVRSYHFTNVNIQSRDAYAVALKNLFGVTGTPSLVVLKPSGEAVCRLEGALKDGDEVREMHRTAQKLLKGAKPELMSKQWPSCFGLDGD